MFTCSSGCVGVHGIGSIWSMTSVGLFAKNDPIATDLNINENTAGLFYVRFQTKMIIQQTDNSPNFI